MEQPLEIDLDPMTVRLMEFVRSHDGPSKVARRIGIKPSVFYNYDAGRNKQPAPDILQRLAKEYPDFDPAYILTGQKSIRTVVAPPAGNSDILAAENAGLRNEIARLEQTISILREVVSNQLGKDMEGKEGSAKDTMSDGQLMLALGGNYRRVERPIRSISMRDARGISIKYPNPAPRNPFGL